MYYKPYLYANYKNNNIGLTSINGNINITSNTNDILQKGSIVLTDKGDINYNAGNDIKTL